MGIVRKWKASSEKENQMVTPVRELEASGNMVEEKTKHVSTVVKKVTLPKTEIVQLAVERVVISVNMVIMLIIAKG